MDLNSIDASIGLVFSLELFKAYKASGTLQAPLKSVPGMPKNSIVSLQLVDGVVTFCSLQEKGNPPYRIAKDLIARMDDEHGPFEWKFTQSTSTSTSTTTPVISSSTSPSLPSFSPVTPPPLSRTPGNTPYPSSTPLHSIPKIVARLNWIRLRTWPYEQRQAIYLVWQLIDGQRSVQDLQFMLSDQLSHTTINEVLRFLVSQHIITIS